MHAIRIHQFGPPPVLQLDEIADPKATPDHVVVRLRAAGVNPVDAYVRAGTYPMKPPLPYTPGMDGAGEVAAVGANVVNLKVGDRVFISSTANGKLQGAYATMALCHASAVHPLPDRLSFAQGAAVNVNYVTAFRALFHRANAKAGEIVFIHGASGGVGTAAVQLAASHGCLVIGSAGTDRGIELVKSLGATHALNHKSPGYLEDLKKITAGKGVDVVIEMLANVNLDKDLGIVGPGGRIVVVGTRGNVEINPRQMFPTETIVTALTYWSGGDAAVEHALAGVSAGLANGSLTPVVGRELPLRDAAEAHRLVLEESAHGKIVLICE